MKRKTRMIESNGSGGESCEGVRNDPNGLSDPRNSE